MVRTIYFCLLAWFVFCAAVFILLPPVRAHDAIPTAAQPLGWMYPMECCSNYDCRRAAGKGEVVETKHGYNVPSGEVIDFADKRIKNSPDGEFHWCTVAGLGQQTLCLFAPPRGY
jgi:hypothetical protein